MGTVERGHCLRNARRAKKMTQEELSRDLCSAEVVSRVENGKAKVTDDLFNKLLARGGIREKVTPGFRDRDDFRASYNLALAEADIDVFKFKNALKLLDYVREINFGETVASLQKWICLMTAMQLFVGYRDFSAIEKNIEHALLLTSDSLYVDRIYTAVEKELYFELLACKIGEKDSDQVRFISDFMVGIDKKYASSKTESDATTYLYFKMLNSLARCVSNGSDILEELESMRTIADNTENAAVILIYHSIHALIAKQLGESAFCEEELELIVDSAYVMRSPLLIGIAGYTNDKRAWNI